MRITKRYTLGKMKERFLRLQKANYESVLITDVINDLHRIQTDKRIKEEDL